MTCKENLMEELKKNRDQDVIVAFSGGVDSSLILKLCCEQAKITGNKVYAITFHTQLHPMNEIKQTQDLAQEMGAEHLILYVDELSEAKIENNPVDRCYRCKKHLFTTLKRQAENMNISIIYEGSNADDMNQYRPGFQAVKELGIKSPLVASNMNKVNIRAMAEEYGLTVYSKPSLPCMATRFPYNTKLDYSMMEKLDKFEEYIRSLGGYNVRLRIHKEIARIEIDPKDFPLIIEHQKEIIHLVKDMGLQYVTLDLEGFRSGSMDYKIQM